jgi:hypothetical protein
VIDRDKTVTAWREMHPHMEREVVRLRDRLFLHQDWMWLCPAILAGVARRNGLLMRGEWPA